MNFVAGLKLNYIQNNKFKIQKREINTKQQYANKRELINFYLKDYKNKTTFCTSQQTKKSEEGEEWEAIVGIEVHAQLNSKHKLVSNVLNYNIEQEKQKFENLTTYEQNHGPNSFVGFPDGGLPGALPGISEECIANLCKTGFNLGGEIQKFSQFDRKHYFYPDLPTAYQITQQFYPLVVGGKIEISKKDVDYFNNYLSSQSPINNNNNSENDENNNENNDNNNNNNNNNNNDNNNNNVTKVKGERKQKRIKEQLQREIEKKEKRIELLQSQNNLTMIKENNKNKQEGEEEKEEFIPITSSYQLYTPPLPKDEGEKRIIRISRIHLEHDSGKTINQSGKSFIDLNRSGVGLMEIVSEPDMRSGLEASIYVQKLQKIIRHLNTSSASMEDGSFRCDVNVSVRKRGDDKFGVRCEIKNLNSINNIEMAIDCEIRRHIALAMNNKRVEQETRGFNPQTQLTFTLRKKESEVDYRYFPEPDLPPLILSDEFLAEMKKEVPTIDQKFDEYQKLEIRPELCKILVETPALSDYFDLVLSSKNDLNAGVYHRNPKVTSYWVTGHLMRLLSKDFIGVDDCPIDPSQFASLIDVEQDGLTSAYVTKKLLFKMYAGDKRSAYEMIKDDDFMKTCFDDEKEFNVVQQIFSEKKDFLKEYLETPEYKKERKLNSFIGEVMKITKGKANPNNVKTHFQTLLANYHEEEQ